VPRMPKANEAIRQLHEDNEALVGALHQAVAENRLLRQQAAEQHRNIRVLPTSAAAGQHGPSLPARGSSPRPSTVAECGCLDT
jgi:hypothetical protein